MLLDDGNKIIIPQGNFKILSNYKNNSHCFFPVDMSPNKEKCQRLLSCWTQCHLVAGMYHNSHNPLRRKMLRNSKKSLTLNILKLIYETWLFPSSDSPFAFASSTLHDDYVRCENLIGNLQMKVHLPHF